MTTTQKHRPGLHVLIVNDLTGAVEADVDAPSTADGLAYFLSSRDIDPEATEDRILADKAWTRRNMRPPGPRETLAVERRNPFAYNTLEFAYFAEVRSDHCDYCRSLGR